MSFISKRRRYLIVMTRKQSGRSVSVKNKYYYSWCCNYVLVFFYYVLQTVHLSIVLAINQLNAKNLLL